MISSSFSVCVVLSPIFTYTYSTPKYATQDIKLFESSMDATTKKRLFEKNFFHTK